jgi:hypothetical protein
MSYGAEGHLVRRPRSPPGREGRFEIGSQHIVGPGELIGGERVGSGERYAAVINIRESAIGHMAARGRIDATQLQAAERFRRLWERAAIGPSRSLDPERFGTGGHEDPISEALLIAHQELAAAMRGVGKIGCRLLVQVIVEGRRIEDVARAWGQAGGIVSGRRAEGYVTGRVVEALDDLVRVWRMEARGRPRRCRASYRRAYAEVPVSDAIRASGPLSVTGPSHEIAVDPTGVAVRAERRPKETGGGQVSGSSSSKRGKR